MEKSLQKKLKTGLTGAEVAEKQAAGLVNGDFSIHTKSYGRIIKDNLFSLFNLINIILFVCILIAGSPKNGLFFLVVIWNFALGVIQEVRAKKAIERLSLITAPKVMALRDGKTEIIQSKDLVLGEIMRIKSGNQICADCVVLEGECNVNESLITGESEPVYKKTGDHLLSGSFCLSGSVMAEAEHTGADNYVSRITQGAGYIKKNESVILDSVRKVVRIIAIGLIPLAGLMIWKNFFVIDQSFSAAMIAVVASASAMIPGGLVLLVSMVMAVSVIRLSAKKTLARDLYCVESLARVDVLCLDKTGTITEGVMTVEDVIPLAGYDQADLETFAMRIEDDNMTIGAVRSFLDIDDEKRTPAPSDMQTPFSSDNKWSLLRLESGRALILGAFEKVGCGIGEDLKETINKHSEKGKRVLVFADSMLPSTAKSLPEEMNVLAVIVIADRVRSNAKETLDFFKKEDVTLKVISGDNPVTVSKIAAEAGLENADKYIDASTFKSYEDIVSKVEEYTIFGRVTPYQKLDIIKALKAHGHTCAMIGDGANDVLALKEADCSIAMQSGSDAARTSASMVLLESDFSRLPFIVAEGRRSINNLQRSTGLYLTKTIYSFILTILFLFVPFTYPFQSIQVTLIGAVTIGMPSFFLALEPNSERVKKNFLTNVFKMALPSGLLSVAGIIASVLIAHFALNADTSQIQTIATFTAIIIGFIVIFDIAGKINKWKVILMAFITLVAAFFIVLFPGLFDIVPLDTSMWLVVMAVCAVFFIIHFSIFRVIRPLQAAKEIRM